MKKAAGQRATATERATSEELESVHTDDVDARAPITSPAEKQEAIERLVAETGIKRGGEIPPPARKSAQSGAGAERAPEAPKQERRITGALRLAAAQADFGRLICFGSEYPVPMELGDARGVHVSRLTVSSTLDATALKRQVDSWVLVPMVVHFDVAVEGRETAERIKGRIETALGVAGKRIKGGFFGVDKTGMAEAMREAAEACGARLMDEDAFFAWLTARSRKFERMVGGAR